MFTSFSGPVEPRAGVQNLLACGSQSFDCVGSRMAAGPWLGSPAGKCQPCQPFERSYDAACDAGQCRPAAYTTPAPPEIPAGAYQTSSYHPVDWTARYPCVAAGEDGKNSSSMIDSCQSGDDWSSGVCAKKIKQVRPATHGARRTTQAVSRRASTGSLLYTTVSLLPNVVLMLL